MVGLNILSPSTTEILCNHITGQNYMNILTEEGHSSNLLYIIFPPFYFLNIIYLFLEKYIKFL
jgi:hypothetical protein